MTIVLSEQPGRKLYQIEDKVFWDKLPKDLKGVPVYFMRTENGTEFWPDWNEYLVYPSIWVSP